MLKEPRIAKFLHKRGKIWGRNNEIFRRVGKTLIRDFFEAFSVGEVAKNFAKKFLHSSALFRKYFARFTKEVQLVKTFQFKSKN